MLTFVFGLLIHLAHAEQKFAIDHINTVPPVDTVNITEILQIKKNQNIFSQATETHIRLNQMRDHVSILFDIDPIALLIRQKALFDRFFQDQVYDFANIISGELGHIRQINALESALYEKHLNMWANIQTPTEFHAWVLENKNSLFDYYTIVFTSSNEPGVGTRFDVLDELKALDWIVRYDMHNHPFILDPTGIDIAGTLIPSDPDIATYRQLADIEGPMKAVVTNGFNSIEFDETEFVRMRSQ